jgi:transposase
MLVIVTGVRQGRERTVEHFVGLDVAVRETSICIVDNTGKAVKEIRVTTEPEVIAAALAGFTPKRVGLEAGPLSQWLYAQLATTGVPVVCVETRHMKAALSAQINKTDRNDARGIAQMMRVGLYKPVHVKTLASQERRLLLTSRKLLQAKLFDLENEIRGTFKNFGLKVGLVRPGRFEARIRELLDGRDGLTAIILPLLVVHATMLQQLAVLHKRLLDTVRADPLCRRLMTVPGVGPVIALTFQATVDVPSRFRHSRSIGAHFGLTPKRYASGETNYSGRVSKCGDAMVRVALYEGAQALLCCTKRWSRLKAWGMAIARRRGMRRAIVAVARKLAVIMHRLWLDGTTFRWSKDVPASA